MTPLEVMLTPVAGGGIEPEKWSLCLELELSDSTFPAGYINGSLPSPPHMSFSKQIQPFTEFYFSPILVFQNISLGNSNACKCNDWSAPPPLLPLILFPLSVLKASKVNHMVGFALSQKIMGSYSSLCRPSKFHTKGRKLHVPPSGKV